MKNRLIDLVIERAFKYSEVRSTMRKASILRGPELFIQGDHTLPLMHLAILYPGGRLMETESSSGITSLLLHSLLLSARGGETSRIRRQLEIYGASVRPFVGSDYFGLMVTVIARNVELALELLPRRLQLPDFEKEDLGWLKRLQGASPRGCETGICAGLEGASRALFWRIGLMGYNSNEKLVDFCVNSLKDVLKK